MQTNHPKIGGNQLARMMSVSASNRWTEKLSDRALEMEASEHNGTKDSDKEEAARDGGRKKTKKRDRGCY
ncbi:hypothetical protein Bca4012_081277 [Brassica carinata]|uniref:Uncharacterized protein n=1 Tax=Brassica carinata TaxID=52824 RepID=A0A8X7VES6_BRACI|nr:hypothetical protein Bca52824_029423 [Brassica carinata]